MHDYNALDDAELVALTIGGDTDAYGELVGRTMSLVEAAVFSVMHNDPAAEDIAQDTYLCAFTQLKRLVDPSKFAPWVYGIAKRKALHHMSRQKRHGDIDEYADVLYTDSGSPEDEFILNESALRVRKAVGRLTVKNREVVELFYFNGLKVEDIALRLGLPTGTVKSRLHEARIKLREELREMDNNNKNALSPDFIANIKNRIADFRSYYRENGRGDNYLKIFSDIEKTIMSHDDPTEKQSALAELYSARLYSGEKDNAELRERTLEAAMSGNNAEVLASIYIDELLAIGDHNKWLDMIDNKYVPKFEKLGANNQIGKFTFWKSRAYSELGQYDKIRPVFERTKALTDPSYIYNALAVCGLRTCELMDKYADDPLNGFDVTAESWRKEGSKLKFMSQPGFGSSSIMYEKHNMDALTYYTSRCGNMFYDTSMEVGETRTDKEGNRLTVVSYDEQLTTAAGTFDRCMHLFYEEDGNYTADIWYARGVGLAKIMFGGEWVNGSPNGKQTYELVSYNVTGSSDDWFPLETGNVWVYDNFDLPDYLWRRFENEVTWSDGENANISTVSVVTFKKNYTTETHLDSEILIELADRDCQKWDIDAAIGHLADAVKENTSQEAALAALESIAYLGRMKEWQAKSYRFCPMSYNASSMLHIGERITFAESGLWSFGPYRWGSRFEENRIFGVKPFRYLQLLCGCVYNEKWVPGYREAKEYDGADVTVEVSDGGSVTTSAGTFDDCIRVTLDCELKDKPHDRYYFDNYQYTWCGKKEFYYAKGVGLVKFDYTWGDVLDASAELVRYANPTCDASYMPLTLGCEWEYDEITLRGEGYRAKRIVKVACGRDESFMVHDEQEFVYLGTEEEYNEKFHSDKTK